MILLVALLILLCLAAELHAKRSWKVYVRGVAAVSGERVLLREIARPMDGIGQSRWQRLSGRELWSAPAEGRRQTIFQKKLRKLLVSYLGSLAHSCVLPQRLIVHRGGSVLREEEIVSKVKSFLQDRAGGWDGEVQLRQVRLPQFILLSGQEDHVDCSLSTALKPGHNAIVLKVQNARGQTKRKLSGTVFLDLWKAVPCAARPLNRSDLLGRDDVEFRRKNLAYLPHEVWDGKGGPWRLTRSVGTGQAIYARNLEPMPMVCRGDELILVYRGEMIRLQVPAEALEDGTAGETIKVRNLQSRKVILAEITNHSQAVVK
jgi:flagella basal body P-ring formation protein FlgA